MDGQFIIMYLKDGQLYPVAMSQENIDSLQFMMPIIFNGKITVINSPQASAKLMTGKEFKEEFHAV